MQRLLLVLTATAAIASEVTPVQKVIQLLDNMKDKGRKEMEEEQVQYAKFKQFCEQTLIDKTRSIDEATDKMEVLEADIQSSVSEAERLTNEIAVHTADIEAAKAEKANATSIRETERADFSETLKDYTESIDAIGRALKALKDNSKKVALVQLSAARNLKMLPKDALSSIDAYLSDAGNQAKEPEAPSLLMEAASAGEDQAPAPKTYESSSGGVISMLEGLQDKFVDERVALEKEEAAKKHAYELLALRLSAQEAQGKKDLQEKTEFKAKKLQAKATAEGDLEDTTSERSSDKKYHDDLKATCAKKASDFEVRQKTRAEELEAVGKAKDIIAGGAVAGSAEKHLPGLLQKTAGSALALLRMDSADPGQAQVAKFLQQQAAQLNSRVLSALAVRVGDDPLAKVKKMIEQLIVKMNQQANEEADKKAWCDTEMATNKATREDKTDSVDSIKSEIDELNAAVGKLGEEVATMSAEVSELNEAMKSATEIRQKEKEKNLATIKDAKEAQAAVAQALNVLKEFYAAAADATAFVQTSSSVVSGQPEVFGDEPYTGMGGAQGGVVGMLEVIESDFARLEAETTAAEEAGKKEYDEFMEDSKVDQASKKAAIEHKTSKKQTNTQEVTTLEGDLLGTQKELDAALAYFEKLKPDCVDAGASYAERKAQREQEIKDLQQAIEMLEGL
eukprot:gb/GFBE01054819.1/.p1 GENE.gb/GFBE01054819.1/~~gb/GFBE01054819.1/.p1  ORF type:complete len:679 (+),score=287.16 gb/GFBE01054819.1/:1-2037(+)